MRPSSNLVRPLRFPVSPIYLSSFELGSLTCGAMGWYEISQLAIFVSSQVSLNVVILQPFKEEPAPDTQCSDKFLVMTTPVSPSTEIENFTKFVSANHAYLFFSE